MLLCACSAKTLAQQAPSAAQTETAKTEVQPQQTVSMEAVPVRTGVVNDGSSFYYYGQDGNRVEKTGMQTLGGAQYYLNSDYTLHEFVPGPNDCEGTVYIHAGDGGFTFTPHEPGVLELDGALYEVTADGSVLQEVGTVQPNTSRSNVCI